MSQFLFSHTDAAAGAAAALVALGPACELFLVSSEEGAETAAFG